jgi:putative transposase
MIETANNKISIRRQCELLELHRSGYYHQPATETPLNVSLMKQIDSIYTLRPYYGVPRITYELNRQGYQVNHKRIERLMKKMGIQAIYSKPRTTTRHPDHKVYPYLLRNMAITYPDQVWCSDITYIPLQQGYLFLVAIMDWYSRYVINWELSNSLSVIFCLQALEAALEKARPQIMNTDQGSQFTANTFTEMLEKQDIRISMDGRGRAVDNVFIERLWRSLKYEEVYLKSYEDGKAAWQGINDWIEFYNYQRPHSSLGYYPPFEIYKVKGARKALN